MGNTSKVSLVWLNTQQPAAQYFRNTEPTTFLTDSDSDRTQAQRTTGKKTRQGNERTPCQPVCIGLAHSLSRTAAPKGLQHVGAGVTCTVQANQKEQSMPTQVSCKPALHCGAAHTTKWHNYSLV